MWMMLNVKKMESTIPEQVHSIHAAVNAALLFCAALAGSLQRAGTQYGQFDRIQRGPDLTLPGGALQMAL